MKRVGNIYEKIYTMENLRKAYEKAKEGKSHYSEVKMIEHCPDAFLKEIQESLIAGTYKTSDYKVEIINDGYKQRTIHKLPFYPDRIVQWAIMLQTEEFFLRNFIHDTYAAIPKRGPHLALKRLTNILKKQDEPCYCLKLDIEKYFPNMDKEILKSLLRKKFKDSKLLLIFDEIIDSCPVIPIGNYTSQYFANFYLSYFDHWVKEILGINHYLRYMDDLIVIHHSKQELHSLRLKIQEYLRKELKLTLKSNYQIFPVYKNGLDFVGYVSWKNFILLRKRTKKKMIKKMIPLSQYPKHSLSQKCSIMSYYGWILFCNSRHLEKKYLKPLYRIPVSA